MQKFFKIKLLIIVSFVSLHLVANDSIPTHIIPAGLQNFAFSPTRIVNLYKHKDKDENQQWYRYELKPELRNTDIIFEIKGMNFKEIYLYEKLDSGFHYLGKSGNNFRELSKKERASTDFKSTHRLMSFISSQKLKNITTSKAL